MATPKTRDELINEAYAVIANTKEPPEADDYSTIDEYVDPLCDQLAADSIVVVDPEEIPVEIFMPLVRLLVNVCGPKYGSPMNEDAKRIDEQALRRISSAKPTYEVLKAEYF